MFNQHVVYTVENSSGKAPVLQKLKIPFLNICLLDFPEARTEDINAIIMSLNPNKAPEFDLIPLKIMKATATIIVINNDLKVNSVIAKIVRVRKTYKRKIARR